MLWHRWGGGDEVWPRPAVKSPNQTVPGSTRGAGAWISAEEQGTAGQARAHHVAVTWPNCRWMRRTKCTFSDYQEGQERTHLSTAHRPTSFSSPARMQAGVRVVCFPLLSPFDARSPPAELVDTGEAEATSNSPQRNAENTDWRMHTATLLQLFRYERGVKDTSLSLWDRGVTPDYQNSFPLRECIPWLCLSLNLNLKYYPRQGLCPLVLNVSRGLDQRELPHQLGVRRLLAAACGVQDCCSRVR